MKRWIHFLFVLPLAAAAADSGYAHLGFDRLASFKFVAPDGDAAKPPAGGGDQIPASIKAFDGRKAVVTGFMLPTKLDNGKATEFLLMANQMACCYGMVPVMNDWVIVRMPQGVDVTQDVPLSFHGTFHVGPVFQDGYLTAIYTLDSEGGGDVTN